MDKMEQKFIEIYQISIIQYEHDGWKQIDKINDDRCPWDMSTHTRRVFN